MVLKFMTPLFLFFQGGDSYRVAVQTELPDDGKQADGTPNNSKKKNKKDKKKDLNELKQELEFVSMTKFTLLTLTQPLTKCISQ